MSESKFITQSDIRIATMINPRGISLENVTDRSNILGVMYVSTDYTQSELFVQKFDTYIQATIPDYSSPSEKTARNSKIDNTQPFAVFTLEHAAVWHYWQQDAVLVVTRLEDKKSHLLVDLIGLYYQTEGLNKGKPIFKIFATAESSVVDNLLQA